MVAFNLALGHWVVRRRARMFHMVLFQKGSQLSRDITRTIVREQPGAMLDESLVQSRGGERYEQGLLHIRGSHGGRQFPSDDVPREVIQHRGEIVPAPALDLEVGEVRLPQFMDALGGLLEVLCS